MELKYNNFTKVYSNLFTQDVQASFLSLFIELEQRKWNEAEEIDFEDLLNARLFPEHHHGTFPLVKTVVINPKAVTYADLEKMQVIEKGLMDCIKEKLDENFMGVYAFVPFHHPTHNVTYYEPRGFVVSEIQQKLKSREFGCRVQFTKIVWHVDTTLTRSFANIKEWSSRLNYPHLVTIRLVMKNRKFFLDQKFTFHGTLELAAEEGSDTTKEITYEKYVKEEMLRLNILRVSDINFILNTQHSINTLVLDNAYMPAGQRVNTTLCVVTGKPVFNRKEYRIPEVLRMYYVLPLDRVNVDHYDTVCDFIKVYCRGEKNRGVLVVQTLDGILEKINNFDTHFTSIANLSDPNKVWNKKMAQTKPFHENWNKRVTDMHAFWDRLCGKEYMIVATYTDYIFSEIKQ